MNRSTTPTTRVSRRPSATVKLRPHTPQLLAFIYFTRYVTWELVLRSFRGVINSKSSAKEQLKQLRDAGYLKTAPRSAVTAPHVYSIAPKGVRLLNHGRNPGRHLPPVRDETVKHWLLEHELGISELQADIRLAAISRPDLSIRFFERRYHQADKQLRYPSSRGVWSTIRPDLGFLAAIKRHGRQHLLWHACEYDRGTEDPTVVLDKLRAYDEWFHTTGRQYLTDLYTRHGAADPRPVYRRVIVTKGRPEKDRDDEHRLAKLVAQFMELPEISRASIFVTTDELLRTHRDDDGPLSHPIWLPLKFTRGWTCDDPPSDPDRTKKLYAWTRNKVVSTSRYMLFPPE